MFEDVQEFTYFDIKYDFFKRYIAFSFQKLVFLVTPGKEFHRVIIIQCVPFELTLSLSASLPFIIPP